MTSPEDTSNDKSLPVESSKPNEQPAGTGDALSPDALRSFTMLDLYEQSDSTPTKSDEVNSSRLKCSRCSRVSNVSSRYTACGIIHCTRPEHASTQINRFLDDIVVWQIRLCQTCLEPAQADSLRARERQAFTQLILKGPITLLLSVGGTLIITFEGPHKSGFSDFFIPLMTVICGIILVSTAWEYTVATFKRRNWDAGKRRSRDVKSAFEGEAYRLLKARDSTEYPKPKLKTRAGVPDEIDTRVVAVAEGRAELEKNLDEEWRKLLHAKSQTAGGTATLADAARQLDLSQVDALLKSGRDPNAEDQKGDLPLNCAFLGAGERTGSTDAEVLKVIRLLVTRGANPNGRSKKGWTPLHGAAFCGYSLSAKFLLESKAAVDASAEGGATPLMTAARAGHASLVKILLEHGAKTDVKADNGVTALDIAKEWSKGEVVKLLQSSQARRS